MMHDYTVFGYWAETEERFGEWYRAISPRGAESQAQLDAQEKGGTLRVARVVAGHLHAVDLYTLFVDPLDPRNLDAEDLELPTDALEGDPDWTVFGIAAPAGSKLGRPDMPTVGERYGDVVPASNPMAAEDVARDRLKDKGGMLIVCTVLEGRVAAADTYASFVDPDVQVA